MDAFNIDLSEVQKAVASVEAAAAKAAELIRQSMPLYPGVMRPDNEIDSTPPASSPIEEIADKAAAIVLSRMKAEAGPGKAFTIDGIAEKAALIALDMIAEKERKGPNFRKIADIPDEPLVTHGSANVFDDLGFSPEEADDLKERSDLMSSLRDRVRVLCWSPDSAAAALRCPTAVMIDLYAGNIDAFTLPALRDYKAALDRYEDWLKTRPSDHPLEAQGWICVEDRLPAENVVVEAAFSEDGLGRFKASLDCHGQWRGAIKYPKAWRPLPSDADSDDRPAPSPPSIAKEDPKSPKALNKAIDRMWLDRLIPEGHIYREVDRFFVFAPQKGFGAIAPWALRLIADHIDALNKPWQEELERSIEESKTNDSEAAHMDDWIESFEEAEGAIEGETIEGPEGDLGPVEGSFCCWDIKKEGWSFPKPYPDPNSVGPEGGLSRDQALLREFVLGCIDDHADRGDLSVAQQTTISQWIRDLIADECGEGGFVQRAIASYHAAPSSGPSGRVYSKEYGPNGEEAIVRAQAPMLSEEQERAIASQEGLARIVAKADTIWEYGQLKREHIPGASIAGPTYDQEEVKILASMSPEEVQATIEEAKQSLLEKARRIL